MQYDDEYFKSEEFRQLLDSYEASIEAGNSPFMDADELIDIADYYYLNMEYDKAFETVDHALELYPHATLPNAFMARKALQEEDIQQAQAYADAIEDHDDPDYYYLKAELLLAEGKVEQADRFLRDYGLTVPDDEHEDFIKDCANLFIDYGESDKAYEWMLRSRGDESNDFKELMGRAHIGMGKYKEAQQVFNELIDRDPYSVNYWKSLASAQFMNDEIHDAITSYEYVLAINPDDPEGLLGKANALLSLGNNEEAQKFLKRYNEINPDDEQALLFTGCCMANLNRTDEAIRYLLRAEEVSEEDSSLLPKIYTELAFCYSKEGLLGMALEMMDKTLPLDCDHIEMMVVRGHVQLENGDEKGAEKSFSKALAMSNSEPYILLRIITSLYDNHYIHACYEMLKKFFALEIHKEEKLKNGLSFMALCCYELGKNKEFLYFLKLACERNPIEATVVLGHLFPEGMEVKDYYHYMKELINSKSVN